MADQDSTYRLLLIERSLAAVSPHLPPGCLPLVRNLLRDTPMLVTAVKKRKSKYGDHRYDPGRRHSIVTINACGNPYRFLLTLLHETAHAQIAHSRPPGRSAPAPHGSEWKTVFSSLLRTALPLLDEELRVRVAAHARRPARSVDSDPALALALHRYDAPDSRPTVAELAPGQKFSLDGKRIMTKQGLMRKFYRCTTAQGEAFRVSPAARVAAVYPDADIITK